MEIKIIKDKISITELKNLAKAGFGDMVKAVADVEKRILAVGGELHADAEKVLIENGSDNKDLWGFNIYPFESKETMLEYSSLINIKPASNNLSMEIQNEEIKKQIKEIAAKIIAEYL